MRKSGGEDEQTGREQNPPAERREGTAMDGGAGALYKQPALHAEASDLDRRVPISWGRALNVTVVTGSEDGQERA